MSMPATIHRFRGTWVSGQAYETRDIAVTGRWSFEAIMDHVGGQQSQPGHGAHWTRYWRPIEGFGGYLPAPSVAQQGQPARGYGGPEIVTPPTAQILHLPAPSGVSLDAGVPAPDDVAEPAAPQLPMLPAAASQIPDDSDIKMPNVAMALSWVKAMLAQTVRREDLVEDLTHLEAQLRELAARIGDTLRPILTPAQIEALARKARVYGVESVADVTAAEMKMMRAQIRLLRKRDAGEPYTAHDAAMATILDSMSRAIAAIDEAADALEQTGASDVEHDKHWPILGAS